MKDKIALFVDENIEECEILLKQASGSARECILGTLNAFESVKDFIDELNKVK